MNFNKNQRTPVMDKLIKFFSTYFKTANVLKYKPFFNQYKYPCSTRIRFNGKANISSCYSSFINQFP